MTDRRLKFFGAYAARLSTEQLCSGSAAIVSPWDENVDFRADELANCRDAAYTALTTVILDLLSESVVAQGSILDAGCGLGYLADSMVAAGFRVIGVDPSRHSIGYAMKRFDTIRVPTQTDAIGFHTQTIELYATDPHNTGRHDAVIANMVMHTTPQLDAFVESAAQVLRPGGRFIATIPHPCFFLASKKTAYVPFNYSENCGFLIPFRIQGGRTHPEPVPYFQHTLQDYSEAMHRAGLSDLRIREPQQIGKGRRYDIAIFESRKCIG
jgi:2-polyprenyl-3-methyl-5-hydroxy-6-metoxy-1,4-benzoquinol methylase